MVAVKFFVFYGLTAGLKTEQIWLHWSSSDSGCTLYLKFAKVHHMLVKCVEVAGSTNDRFLLSGPGQDSFYRLQSFWTINCNTTPFWTINCNTAPFHIFLQYINHKVWPFSLYKEYKWGHFIYHRLSISWNGFLLHLWNYEPLCFATDIVMVLKHSHRVGWGVEYSGLFENWGWTYDLNILADCIKLKQAYKPVN